MTPEPNYPTTPDVNAGELPDPFAWPDGRRVTSAEEWPARAADWLSQIVDLEYGGMPPPPTSVVIEPRSHSLMRRWDNTARIDSYGVRCHGGEHPFFLSVQVTYPKAEGRYPVILCGDGCWSYFTDEMARRIVDSGYALAIFNRTEVVEDLVYGEMPFANVRSGGLYNVYPGQTFGALAAWAWGYHRAVDLLTQLPFIDAGKIAITGHSRGAKTTLLAGATDPRIALVHDNASCAGGAAAFRYVGHGGESLEIIRTIASWFGTGLQPYLNAVGELPFDQHCLLATIAPRPLLLTYALDDRFSNPEGMVQTAAAVREVYRFLRAEEKFAYHLRSGPHFFRPDDLGCLLEFMAWHWQGEAPQAVYNTHPYTHLPKPFAWAAPP